MADASPSLSSSLVCRTMLPFCPTDVPVPFEASNRALLSGASRHIPTMFWGSLCLQSSVRFRLFPSGRHFYFLLSPFLWKQNPTFRTVIAGALRLLIDENGYLSYGEFLRLVPPPEFLVLSSRFKGPPRVPRATASNSFPSGQIMRRSYHRVYSFESSLEA